MPKSKNKFWNFKEAKNETPAELVLYGDISSESWWGDEVTPQTFNEELKALGNIEELTVRINSGGGDVFAASAIYTRLREHKAKITVKIDGWAASAATMIAMAGDEIEIADNGVFMIHDPLFGLFGYYNATAMAKMQSELAVVKNSIVAAYKLKTGKEEEEINQLMSAETWYTAKEAVEAGFADKLMFETSTEAVVNSGTVSINGIKMNNGQYKPPTKILDLYQNHAGKGFNIKTKNEQEPKKEEEKEMEEIKTVEELKEAYPDLVKEIEEAAKAEERERIQEIEELEEPGTEEITDNAKYKTFENAGAVAIKILNAKKQQGANYLTGRKTDVENSGVGDISPAATGTTNKENEFLSAIDKAYPTK